MALHITLSWVCMCAPSGNADTQMMASDVADVAMRRRGAGGRVEISGGAQWYACVEARGLTM
jgi:hypothetical protein